jgi:hypothetical protein
MENFEYDNKNVVALISEMEQAGKYFENYAPAVCLKAAEVMKQMVNHISYLETCIEKREQYTSGD